MHALLVTFRPEASEEEIMPVMAPKMEASVPASAGLIMKALVGEAEDKWGGFYLFATAEDAQAYLQGEFYTWMSETPLLSNLEARHFHVDDEPSIAFGTPSVPLANSR